MLSDINPGNLPGYGSRAWCRSLWAEIQVVRPELMRGGHRGVAVRDGSGGAEEPGKAGWHLLRVLMA